MRSDREYKEWLVSLFPDGWGKQELADELDVDRRTLYSLLRPKAPGLGHGRTLMRYLDFVGALSDPPAGKRQPRLVRLDPEQPFVRMVQQASDGVAQLLVEAAREAESLATIEEELRRLGGAQ